MRAEEIDIRTQAHIDQLCAAAEAFADAIERAVPGRYDPDGLRTALAEVVTEVAMERSRIRKGAGS